MDPNAYITVFPPGTQVRLSHSGGLDGIKAIVTQVTISGWNAVRYEVVWFDGRTRKCEWVEPFEIENVELETKRTVGFETPKPQTP